MSGAGAPPIDARGAPEADSYPWVPSLALTVIGALAVVVSSLPMPIDRGAVRCVAPETLLSLFDASLGLFLIRPGRRGLAETLALVALAAPFHAALAASAFAGPGAHVALATSCAAWAAMALVTGRYAPRSAPLAASLLVFGLPLAAYGLVEFARLPLAGAFRASPLVGPVVLAHRASFASPGDAVPALVATTIASLLAIAGERRLHRPARSSGT